ncbi:SspB family protein [Methylovirgula sp. HY1]|uniref:SspB family protein n=1 Tax=Methylovirgula sp. HY1 TaxID=2822761 RepID=UPI001C5A7131|nr:ClpXP protease specificity-enhancing factor SspB [Methylovirgula sp. HY1]QXX75861.1 hypothetical protein MHY1_02694 [Methylovirgula sp. HY1]
MATDLIRYDLLVQDALRGVVRRVLTEAARDGLPGDHHFFISFRTRALGVRLSNRMREQYPQEMTIVLQHQFWDLVVGDLGFEVGLSFQGKPEILAIPYSAVSGFFDPSVDFGLKFEIDTEAAVGGPALQSVSGGQNPVGLADAAPRLAAVDKSKPRGSGSEPAEVGPTIPASEATAEVAGPAAVVQPANEPNVVSIDAFRKKP